MKDTKQPGKKQRENAHKIEKLKKQLRSSDEKNQSLRESSQEL